MAGRNTGAVSRNGLPSPFVRFPLRTLTEEMEDRTSTAGSSPSAMSTLNGEALSRSLGENPPMLYGSDRPSGISSRGSIRSDSNREFSFHRATI